MDFSQPMFILSPDGKPLHSSFSTDETAANAYSFNGSINQQWLVHGDGDNQVALMSRFNKQYLGPEAFTAGSGIVFKDVPFWWKIRKEVEGYKLADPDTNLALHFGDTVTIRSDSEATRLYILECSASNEVAIKTGKLPWTTGNVSKSLNTSPNYYILLNSDPSGSKNTINTFKELQQFFTSQEAAESMTNITLQASHLGVSSVLDGSDGYVTVSTVGSHSDPPAPNKSRKGIAVFGTSTPKKLVYGLQSAGTLRLVTTAMPDVADIVGFGGQGVVIWTKDTGRAQVVSSKFGNDQASGNWKNDRHVRLLADTTGNRRTDIVGFGENGVWVSINNGDNTFQEPKRVLSDFSYKSGWRINEHLRLMVDIRNTGRADILGFHDQGVLVSLNNGDGTFSTPKRALTSLGTDAGSSINAHIRILADFNGNGLLDILALRWNTDIAFNNGDGTFQPPKFVLPEFGNGQEWKNDRHPRFVADLTGNGIPDLIGIKDDGVYVALNKGDGTFQQATKVMADEFCYDKGWRVDQHPRFVVDLTGNGCGDIIGFGKDGVYVAINNGDGTFRPVKHVSKHFGYDEDWRVDEHQRFVVDMTGNGRGDIVGIGDQGVYVSYNDGEGNFGSYTFLTSCFGTSQLEWLPHKAMTYVANLKG